jgi:hypothetical protein
MRFSGGGEVACVQQLREPRGGVGVDVAMRLVSVVLLVACAASAQPPCAPKTPRTPSGPDVFVGETVVAFRSTNGRLLVRRLADGAVRFNANSGGEVLFADDTRALLLRTSGAEATLLEVVLPSGAFRKPAGRWMQERHTVDVWSAAAGWVMSWSSTVPPGHPLRRVARCSSATPA